MVRQGTASPVTAKRYLFPERPNPAASRGEARRGAKDLGRSAVCRARVGKANRALPSANSDEDTKRPSASMIAKARFGGKLVRGSVTAKIDPRLIPP
jgi:hypothetical protein